MLTFSDLHVISQLKFELCLPPKPLHEYACTNSLKFPSFAVKRDTVLEKIPGVLLTCCKKQIFSPSCLWLGCVFLFDTHQEVNLDFQATVIIIKFTILNLFMTILKYNLFPW